MIERPNEKGIQNLVKDAPVIAAKEDTYAGKALAFAGYIAWGTAVVVGAPLYVAYRKIKRSED